MASIPIQVKMDGWLIGWMDGQTDQLTHTHSKMGKKGAEYKGEMGAAIN